MSLASHCQVTLFCSHECLLQQFSQAALALCVLLYGLSWAGSSAHKQLLDFMPCAFLGLVCCQTCVFLPDLYITYLGNYVPSRISERSLIWQTQTTTKGKNDKKFEGDGSWRDSGRKGSSEMMCVFVFSLISSALQPAVFKNKNKITPSLLLELRRESFEADMTLHIVLCQGP